MNKLEEKLGSIFIRYFLMILGGLSGLAIFSIVFTPLTLYPSYFLLDLFFNTSLSGIVILINGIFPIEIIESCVASSAYYLLFILNLSIPNIKIKKRLTILGESFLILLIVNLLRIFFLSLLYISGSNLFDFSHRVFWYLSNIIFIAGIWFIMVKHYKLKKIPFYTDVKFLFNLLKSSKKSKSSKKNK